MSVERKEVGPRMSQIVIHGNTVYLAGIVAHQNAGKSVTEQTREILGTIDRYLREAGSDKSKLLSANIWLTDIATFNEMNAVWDAWVAPGNTPARATVEARLAAPQYKVEIMVVAAR
jgi:enamine deaminase RidA (YjgF/YER057c/UK114 family)